MTGMFYKYPAKTAKEFVGIISTCDMFNKLPNYWAASAISLQILKWLFSKKYIENTWQSLEISWNNY